MVAVVPLSMKDCSISLGSTITHASGHIASELDNEVVMMSIEQGEYYGFGQIGSAIWRLIDKPTKVEDIVSHFLKQYNVSLRQCQEDVLAFINQLDEKGLIAVCD